MRRGADAGGGHVDLARIGLGVRDELGDGFRRHVRVDLHHVRHADEARDWRHVADEVERQILIKRGVDGVGRIDQEHRVAVGIGLGGHFGREIIAGARLVLDDELLAHMLRQILSDQARDDVGRAARRIADQPAHRVVRIIVGRARGAGNACQRNHASAAHANAQAASRCIENFIRVSPPKSCCCSERRSLRGISDAAQGRKRPALRGHSAPCRTPPGPLVSRPPRKT